MISSAAVQGLDSIFTKAARTSLVVNAVDQIQIDKLPGSKVIAPPEDRFLVLTISSYRFRLLTMLHYSRNKLTNAYFNKAGDLAMFDNNFGEYGNLCCGAMKRDIGRYFMHLGLSTPFTLDNKCMSYLSELKPAHVIQYKIDINQGVGLHATLCLCAYGEIHFEVANEDHQVDTGGLELF